MWQKIKNFFRNLFKSKESGSVKEEQTKIPQTPTKNVKWGYIVAHTDKAQGAVSPSGESEYEHALRVTRALDVPFETRDIGGVYGAASRLVSKGCTYSLEDHKNAYNGKVKGLEVLVMLGDKASENAARRLISIFKKHYPEITLRADRGVKFLKTGERGYQNLHSAKKAGMKVAILVEAFFIDNPEDYIHYKNLTVIYNEFFKNS